MSIALARQLDAGGAPASGSTARLTATGATAEFGQFSAMSRLRWAVRSRRPTRRYALASQYFLGAKVDLTRRTPEHHNCTG
jgi:hypothetical protein